VLNHSRVRLRKKRQIRHPSARRDAVEADLIAEDRLACAWLSLHKVDAALQQSTFNDPVQAGDSGWNFF
jgi:hypothetical protein